MLLAITAAHYVALFAYIAELDSHEWTMVLERLSAFGLVFPSCSLNWRVFKGKHWPSVMHEKFFQHFP